MTGKFTFRNKSDQDKFVPGVGIVKAGESVSTDVLIENSDFEQTTAPAKPSDVPSGTQTATQTEEKPADAK